MSRLDIYMGLPGWDLSCRPDPVRMAEQKIILHRLNTLITSICWVSECENCPIAESINKVESLDVDESDSS